MIFVTVVIVPTIVALLAQCTPVTKLWNAQEPGTCWDPQRFIDFGYFSGGKSSWRSQIHDRGEINRLVGASVLSDWILASLPIVFMWNLQMTIRNKVGICILMGMGYL